jgi:AAA+ superfamily predicted ATPase
MKRETQDKDERRKALQKQTLEIVNLELSKLVGLDPVKERFEALKDYVRHRDILGIESIPHERFHAIFQGNPGTGKCLAMWWSLIDTKQPIIPLRAPHNVQKQT